VLLEGRAGHRRPQTHLGGHLAAVAAQSTVPQGGVDPLAGGGEGRLDVGEREQRGEWISSHRPTVAGKRPETWDAQSGSEVARFAQYRA
jgi:hypothetical protein